MAQPTVALFESDGVQILVEVTRIGGYTEKTGTRGEKVQAAVVDAFDNARAAIETVASSTISTIDRLRTQAISPQEVEAKFGLKFTADGNVILASASAEASLEITLKYRTGTSDAPG